MSSGVSASNGGEAYLVIESADLRLRLVRDRTQLLLDFQPTTAKSSSEWFSVDLIRRLFLGVPETSGVLDESYAAFVQERLIDIEELFRESRWAETQRKLKALKVTRSKELFG